MHAKGQEEWSAWMRHALALATRGLGNVWPNPAVGALVISDGRIAGRGFTQPGGRPHAETQAIAQAGANTKGATMVVTLEPCAHHGKTPPCAEAIIHAGISRVISACEDPDPRVAGKGHAMLREAGIDVISDILAAESRALNEGFFSVISRGRPYVAMKIASSLDGRSATHTGESRWITGDFARTYGHRLRSAHDAILTGIGTVLSDDPSLTCRLPGLESRSPVRVVIDSFLKILPTSKLVATARETPLWILTLESQKNSSAFETLEKAGAKMICLPPAGRRIDLSLGLTALAKEGITRLLVEAGGQLSGAFLEAEFVDRIHWFRAPMLIGSKGQSAIASELPALLSSLPRYTRERSIPLGADILETYRI